MELIPHSLTPRILNDGIRSLTGFGSRVRPLAQPVLYLHHSTPGASPKAISGRTRYLRVRLAFYLYPQLIPRFCNIGGCGPPLGVTRASPWPWVAHPVSGLRSTTLRPVRTRFPCGSRPVALNLAANRNSPARSAKSTRSHLNNKVLPLFVGIRFQALFHSPSGVLFTFPSRYYYTIGSRVVFSLGRWSSLIHTGLHGPGTTRVIHYDQLDDSPTGLSPPVVTRSSVLRLSNN